MWTVQGDHVMETLMRDGRYFVKKRYITEKYGSTAWIFQEAYSFFIRRAEQMIHRPKEAESPVWLFMDKRWALPDQNSSLLEVRIPASQIVLFDRRLWNKILNLDYVGTKEEEMAFAAELKRQGIACSSDVFERPFYPLLKKQIIERWERLFTGILKKVISE